MENKNKPIKVEILKDEGTASVIVNESSYYAEGLDGRKLNPRFLCNVKEEDNTNKKKKQRYIDRHERYGKHRMG